MSTQIVDRSEFEKGSLGKQVALAVVTLGLYMVYWMYSTARQLDRGTDASLSPILAIVPFYGQWKVADAAEAVTDQSGVLLFVLFLFLGPAAWYLIQTGINDAAAGA
ncbi:DUF4234 domain-containing protein [Halosimplex halophilum]|uniref:DUF4234 domain-containing protein n=1 Tax=Halosimplex halophilum TaxID=2559572 RepID=UPI001FE4A5E2|nr:DUF4234 domain-containing protein [Halosimplex halophilum]